MKKLYLLLLLPQLLTAQSIETRYSQLGDSEKNISRITNVKTTLGDSSNTFAIKLQHIDAKDLFGKTPVNTFSVETAHNISSFSFGQNLGVASFTNNSELLFTTFFQKNYVWSQKNPYNVRIAYDRNLFGVVSNQLRNELAVDNIEADADVFIKNKIWVRGFVQRGAFTDNNERNIFQIDTRHYMSTGIFYGGSIYHQQFKKDVSQDTLPLSRTYWSPENFSSAEGQVGYKFPWNHTKFAGISYLSVGQQRINKNTSQNIFKINGQLVYKISTSNTVSVWGNISNNAANITGPGYQWGTLGTSVNVMF